LLGEIGGATGPGNDRADMTLLLGNPTDTTRFMTPIQFVMLGLALALGFVVLGLLLSLVLM
jgi:hypothetical protein